MVLFVSKPLRLLLVKLMGSYPVEWAWRKCSFPREKGANFISADFWSTQLFLLGLLLLLLLSLSLLLLLLLLLFFSILSSSLDNPKLFRMYLNRRGRRGKFAGQNTAGSFFLSRNTWWLRVTEIFEPLAFAQKMNIGGDKLVIEISRKFWKALEGKEVDSKQTLSGHAACIIPRRRSTN